MLDLAEKVDAFIVELDPAPDEASVVRLDSLHHGVGEVVKKHGLRQHGRVRDLFVDTLNGVAVEVSGDENDRHVAYLSKPPSSLDPFAASFETNVLRTTSG